MNSNNVELKKMVEDNHEMIQEMYTMMTGMKKPETTKMNTMPRRTKMVSVTVDDEDNDEGMNENEVDEVNKKLDSLAPEDEMGNMDDMVDKKQNRIRIDGEEEEEEEQEQVDNTLDEEGFRNKKMEGFAGSKITHNNKLRTLIKVVLIVLIMLFLNNTDTKKQLNHINKNLKLPENSILFIILMVVILLILFLL